MRLGAGTRGMSERVGVSGESRRVAREPRSRGRRAGREELAGQRSMTGLGRVGLSREGSPDARQGQTELVLLRRRLAGVVAFAGTRIS
jgi:hypothetical protein